MPRTKIICTLGPASLDMRVLLKMVHAGMAVARINCSHGNRSQHLSSIQSVREINRRHGTDVGILLDLQGYRIRVGRFGRRGSGGGIRLRPGQHVGLCGPGKFAPGLIPLDYDGPLDRIPVGSWVFIDDGSVALEVTGMASGRLKARVVTPGVVRERKGVNIPELTLPEKGLTEKDRDDFKFGLENGVRLFAQSFVRSRDDMSVLRDFAADNGFSCKLVAKIENRQAVKALDDIMGLSDGIMVARGDLGVSLPFYEVPILQKRILRDCERRHRFGITATQMLESMTEHPRPTRAEVSDVANAVLDGSDFVMLSGETAVGKYPVEAVSAMQEIIQFTEKYAGTLARQRRGTRIPGRAPRGKR